MGKCVVCGVETPGKAKYCPEHRKERFAELGRQSAQKLKGKTREEVHLEEPPVEAPQVESHETASEAVSQVFLKAETPARRRQAQRKPKKKEVAHDQEEGKDAERIAWWW